MTVLRADLIEVLEDLNSENSNIGIADTLQNLKQFIGKTLEVSSGPGAGTVIDPSRPDDLYHRFWQILDVELVGTDQVKLKLLNPSAVDPDKLFDPKERRCAEPRLCAAHTAPRRPRDQVCDHVAERELLRPRGGPGRLPVHVRQRQRGQRQGRVHLCRRRGAQVHAGRRRDLHTPATMQVELSSLIAVARLLANTSGAVDVESLVNGKTIEITVGPGLGRSWRIDRHQQGRRADLRQLTLGSWHGSGARSDHRQRVPHCRRRQPWPHRRLRHGAEPAGRRPSAAGRHQLRRPGGGRGASRARRSTKFASTMPPMRRTIRPGSGRRQTIQCRPTSTRRRSSTRAWATTKSR